MSIHPPCPPASLRRVHPRWALALIGLGIAGFVGVGRAAWAPDGNHLTLAGGPQISPTLASDGAGGAITAWVDSRLGYESNIFAQRIGASGTVPAGWDPDGNGFTLSTCFKFVVAVVPDGTGGALIAWSDEHCAPQHDLYAQRVTASGALAPGWPAGGLPVCLAGGNQDSPVMLPDGAGGAFVTWEDWRSGSSMIYAQHVTGSGGIAPGWPTDGLAVCAAGDAQSLPAIAGDGGEGVIIAWQDRRSGSGDIYLERLTGAGVRVEGWPADGLLVGGAAGNQGSPSMVPDDAGGVLVAWLDHRGSTDDIYATRVSGTGALAPGWAVDGTPVCSAAGDQRKPVTCADGAGGLVVAWQDHRAGSWDVYAQRLDGSGASAPGWIANGAAMCAAAGDQLGVQIVSDAAGGAYLTWQDPRSGSSHIYAQHVTAAGIPAAGWNADGTPVCTAAGSQINPRMIADDTGGAIVAWVDSRTANETAPDLYAQRIVSTGVIATRPTGLAARHQDGQTFLTWTCPPGTGWTYRVYASANPIADGSGLAAATLIGTAGDSTWYDRRLSVLTGQTYAYRPDSAAAPLAPDQGLFVATPPAAGSRYYAVTAQPGGYPDNPAVSPDVNSLAGPVAEQLDTPRPVWQRRITVGAFITPDIYTLWTSDRDTPAFPAMANRPGLAYDCSVVRGGSAPNNALYVNFHGRQGNFLQAVYSTGAQGEWVLGPDDPLPTQDSDTFWYGYHESYDPTLWVNPVQASGTVRDYTLRRTIHTLRWARRNFGVDTTRVYEYGFSMGAIGGFILALHHPELIAAFIDVVGKVDFSFDTDPDPRALFNPGGGLRVVSDRLWGVLGADLPSSEGGTVYEQLNGARRVAELGARAVPPMIAFAGRNDFALGWAEKIPFYHAMRDARQGGTFYWDMRDHTGSALAAWAPMVSPSILYRFRTNLSFPALSNASVDNDPGDGTAASGDTVGTINGHLEWDTAVVDEPQHWQTTLRLRDLSTLWGPAPAPDSASVDVTPRRLQAFAVVPDSACTWQVTRLGDGAIIQSGSILPDATGLLTVPGVKVYRAGSRLDLGLPTPPVLDARHQERRPARPLITLARNPVVRSATLTVAWPAAGPARVDLYDAAGRRVRVLFQGAAVSLTTTTRLEAQGSSAGLYFVVARQGSLQTVQRVVLLR